MPSIKPIVIGASTALVAAAITTAPAAVAVVPAPCSGTYSTPGQGSCSVPAGVTSIEATVVGGNGGNRLGNGGTGSGGLGAKIVTTLTVTPGEVLFFVVGANGQTAETNGGGGAYSSVSRLDYTDPANALIVAGAGGGAGVQDGGNGFGGTSGTGGGNAGTLGSYNGKPGGDVSTPGGTGNAPGGNGGAAGAPGANAGTDVGADGGGGGGAGYGGGVGGVSVGGGGGGGSSTGVAGTTAGTRASGGGGSGYAGGGGGYTSSGGGGSSLAPDGATVTAGDGSPRVKLGDDPVNPVDPVKQPQAIPAGVVKERVKRKGSTVINPANSLTVQGRPLKVKSVKATGLRGRGDVTCFRVVRKPNRLTRLLTTGQCKTKLKIIYTAPGNSSLYSFKQTVNYSRSGKLVS